LDWRGNCRASKKEGWVCSSSDVAQRGCSLVIAPSRGVGRFFLLTYRTTGESMLPLNTSSHIASNKGFGVIAKEQIKSGKGDSGKKKS